MSNTKKYFQELKRRKVFNTAGLYAVSSFIIMQLAALIQPALMLPEWTTRLVLILLVLGFPVYPVFSEHVWGIDSWINTNKHWSQHKGVVCCDINSKLIAINGVADLDLLSGPFVNASQTSLAIFGFCLKWFWSVKRSKYHFYSEIKE